MIRTLMFSAMAALLCVACAAGGGSGGSSLNMYGTLDTGVAYRSH